MSRCASKTSKGSSASQSCFFQWSFKCTSNNIVEKSPNIPKLRLKFVSSQKPQHSIVFPALFLLHFHTHTYIYTRTIITIIICPAEFRICFEAYTPSKRNHTPHLSQDLFCQYLVYLTEYFPLCLMSYANDACCLVEAPLQVPSAHKTLEIYQKSWCSNFTFYTGRAWIRRYQEHAWIFSCCTRIPSGSLLDHYSIRMAHFLLDVHNLHQYVRVSTRHFIIFIIIHRLSVSTWNQRPTCCTKL